jgi:hypothetical protein
LTAHTPGVDPDHLSTMLARALRCPVGRVEAGELGLSTADGRRLGLGAFARLPGAAS